MKANDIDVLLKKSFSQEFSPSPELEKFTWQKMNALPCRRKGFLMMLLSIVGYTLLALKTVMLLSYFDRPALKITFLCFYFSSICFLVLYQIVSNSINLKIKSYV
ncbi:MAG: hypothetical protein FWC34_03195 [Bacteroidetes bacterium]|nr:hypothetical protein [Bacteroidota bacterium]MCL2303489.1 hypothetical protein [Lentimicrobiaceae bacterium]